MDCPVRRRATHVLPTPLFPRMITLKEGISGSSHNTMPPSCPSTEAIFRQPAPFRSANFRFRLRDSLSLTFGQTSSLSLTFGQISSPSLTFGQTSCLSLTFGQTSSPSLTFGQTSSPTLTFGQASCLWLTFGQTSSFSSLSVLADFCSAHFRSRQTFASLTSGPTSSTPLTSGPGRLLL